METLDKTELLKARNLAINLAEELQRLEHREADNCPGFDASDMLTNIRAARDAAVTAQDILLDAS